MSEDAAIILFVEGCAYVGWYIYDSVSKFFDDPRNPFGDA